ncbi:MAG: DegT/DnrJ/EryC1/StrS family aminotransferase [Myxococcales bacterium]|nr:DegT/DnrJ/EryC1/StrS family aminotransferase [Myxococcales bacterium]
MRPLIGPRERAAVDRVLRSGQLACGPEVARLEAEIAAYCDVPFAVATSSGTSALEIGLRALGVGPGDQVVVPSLTFIATANAVRIVGATPVFADVDPTTMCLTRMTVEPHLTAATRAVIAVHLFGHPAEPDALAELCARHGCALVEDCAQALGARWRGRHVGTAGALGAFSFYPTKAMTTGEGGMVITADAALDARLRALRNHGGMGGEYVLVGTNARMTDIAAAIGRVQLEEVNARNAARRVNASMYDHALADVVETPRALAPANHAYHQYTIRADDRPRLLAALKRAGVGYGLYYPKPCHLQPVYAGSGRLPVTERIAAQAVSIPVREDLDASERAVVIAAVRAGVGRSC